MYRLALPAVSLAALMPFAVSAQVAPSQAQAQVLQQQLNAWMTDAFGTDSKFMPRQVTLTPAGDHYDVTAPIGDSGQQWTAIATPKAGGVWSVDKIAFPSPFTITNTMPTGTAAGSPAASGPMTSTFSVGQQSGQMMFDTGFSMPFTSKSSLQNIDVTTSGAQDQKTHIDSGSSNLVVTPVADGHANAVLETVFDGYRGTINLPNASPASYEIKRAIVNGSMTDVSRQKSATLFKASIRLLAAVPKDATPPTDDQAATMKALASDVLDAVVGLAKAATLDEKLQDFALTVDGMAGTLHGLGIGMSVNSADDLLSGKLDLSADGLVLPDIGLGDKVALIPSQVTLRPTISGIPTEAVTAMIAKLKADDTPDSDDIQALFAKGGIVTGLENVTVDVAGAKFAGNGTVTFASPQEFSGTGHVTAANLDLLQQKLASDPDLKQGVPAIIFLKGIGKTVDNRMVWDVTYRNGRLLVNDQDMSAMMGGSGPSGPDTTSPAPGTRAPVQGQGQIRRRP